MSQLIRLVLLVLVWLPVQPGTFAQDGQSSESLRVQVGVARGPHYAGQGFELAVGVVAGDERPKVEPPGITGARDWLIGTEFKPIATSGIGAVVAQQNLFLSRFRVVASRPGTLEIPPILAQINGRSGRSQPRRLEIQPVPLEGRPAEFLGGVGQFSCTGRGGSQRHPARARTELPDHGHGPSRLGHDRSARSGPLEESGVRTESRRRARRNDQRASVTYLRVPHPAYPCRGDRLAAGGDRGVRPRGQALRHPSHLQRVGPRRRGSFVQPGDDRGSAITGRYCSISVGGMDRLEFVGRSACAERRLPWRGCVDAGEPSRVTGRQRPGRSLPGWLEPWDEPRATRDKMSRAPQIWPPARAIPAPDAGLRRIASPRT